MKKRLICLLAVVALMFGAFATADAADRAGRFQTGTGLGFNAGQGGNTAFYWNFGMDYYFTDMISVNPNLFMSVDGFFVFGIAPRIRFTFDLPVDNLEISATAGPGFLIGENSFKEFIFVMGPALYYYFLDGQLGVGTDLNFGFTTASGYVFRLLWSVASVQWRF